MKTRKRTAMCLLLTILLVTGCGQKGVVLNPRSPLYAPTEKIYILREPYEYMGLEETAAIKAGHYTLKKVMFPDDLDCENFPGRVSWSGWVVNPDGKEFWAQALFAGLDESLKPFMVIVIDGDETTGLMPDAKYVTLSSGATFAYDAGGSSVEIFSPEDYWRKPEYRKEIADEHGDKIGDLEKVDPVIMEKIMTNWSYFHSDERGGIKFYSPLTEEQFKEVASINPQYTFAGKFVANSRLMISPDYIAVAISLGFDVMRSADAPSTGWDFDSVISRRNMSFTMRYTKGLYRTAFVREAMRMQSRATGENDKDTVEMVRLMPSSKKKVIDPEETNMANPEIIPVANAERKIEKKEWRWDLHNKDPYVGLEGVQPQTFEQKVAFINRAFWLLGIPEETRASLVDEWRYRKEKWGVLNPGQIVSKILTGFGDVHENVTADWRDRRDPIPIKIYETKGYQVAQTMSGHWILL